MRGRDSEEGNTTTAPGHHRRRGVVSRPRGRSPAWRGQSGARRSLWGSGFDARRLWLRDGVCTLCATETLSAAVHFVYKRDRPDLDRPVRYFTGAHREGRSSTGVQHPLQPSGRAVQQRPSIRVAIRESLTCCSDTTDWAHVRCPRGAGYTT
jgi:hypothetical protein